MGQKKLDQKRCPRIQFHLYKTLENTNDLQSQGLAAWGVGEQAVGTGITVGHEDSLGVIVVFATFIVVIVSRM